jgi:hypothetical protein
MTNLIAPSAIIFVNADLSAQVQGVIQRQLFINDTMTGAEFDARVAGNPNYVQDIHANGLRVLVIRSFLEQTNRELADIVLFCKAGLASVEKTKFGPPGQTFEIDRMYLSQLFNTSRKC